MNRLKFVLFSLLISFDAVGVVAQEAKYPPFSEYLMPQAAEIALAKSAAPDNISSRATIKVLTPSGFQVTREGDKILDSLAEEDLDKPTKAPPRGREHEFSTFVQSFLALSLHRMLHRGHVPGKVKFASSARLRIAAR